MKTYRDEISAGPIEEAADDFKMKAAKEEGTMISMKNHEDFKDLMKEDKDFGDTMQIVNQDKADQKNDEELWGGRPSEVFKDKNVIMLKLDKMKKSEKFEYEEKQNEVFDDVTQLFNKQIRAALAHVTNLEQPCKRQDFQGMVERTVIDSTIEITSTAAMHNPASTQEQEIEWLEPDAIEFAQRHAKLEGKSEYEASRDDGISYYSGGAEDRFYPGGVMKLNICTPMHRKHTGLSQHYAVMEECIAIFGG